MNKRFLCGCLLLLTDCALAAGRWELQFFHDVDKSTLLINDLKFTSRDRGIAVGSLEEKGKGTPAELITLDGGKTWSFVKAPGIGLSLFFLDESIGWMVTPKGIWKTRESGRSWQKLEASPENIVRVHFRDENQGWAIGLKKSAYETSDGGKHWKRLAVLDELDTSEQYTNFLWIDFATPQTGVITGASVRPRLGETGAPGWMQPRQREWPSLNISLETRDGGKSWKYNTTSMFGRMSRVRLLPDGRGLMLVEFLRAFDWPSEVFEVDWRRGGSKRVFRTKDCAVTDVLALPNCCAYLAGIAQPISSAVRSPVPEKVRFFKSTTFAVWEEMDVDYRAVATYVILAAADQERVWAATDTGMILHLVK